MTKRFAKVNEQEISCLTTQHQKYRVCLYNKTIIPFALVVYELIAMQLGAMRLVGYELTYDSSSWYIIVKYYFLNKEYV